MTNKSKDAREALNLSQSDHGLAIRPNKKERLMNITLNVSLFKTGLSSDVVHMIESCKRDYDESPELKVVKVVERKTCNVYMILGEVGNLKSSIEESCGGEFISENEYNALTLTDAQQKECDEVSFY